MPYSRSIFLAIIALNLMLLEGVTHFNFETLPDIIGVDSYLRLLTLQKLLSGADWYEHIITRTNWPHGLEHHWTRPVDILLFPLASFMPIFWAALIYQFLLLTIFAWGMVKTAYHMGATHTNLAIQALILVVYFNPHLLIYFSPARVDHHALLATILIWLIYQLLKCRIIYAGLLAGLGVWVSAEFFIPLLFVSLWIGWCWLKNPQEHYATARTFFAAMLAVMTFGILLERPPSDFTRAIADSLSYPHFILIALTTIAAAILSLPAAWKCNLPLRILKAALFTIGIFLITFLSFPELLKSSFLNISDPLIFEYFEGIIIEMQPPLNDIRNASMFTIILFALPLALMRMRKDGWPLPPILLLIVSIGMTGFLLSAFRWLYYALPVTALLFAYGLSNNYWEKHRIARIGIIFTIIILPLAMVFPYAPRSLESAENNICENEISTLIRKNQLGNKPLNLAIEAGKSYETLFFTPHHVLASNNHRNEKGLGDLLRIINSKDKKVAKEIAKRRKIDVIVTCPHLIAEDSYLQNPPSWIKPHPLAKDMNYLKIWNVKSPE